MLLEIWFSDDTPPAGVVKVEGDPPKQFQGWLGLLQTISRALETGSADEAACLRIAR